MGALPAIGRILSIAVPLPVWLILVIAAVPAGWVAVKGRQHARAAVERLVAGERIAGLEATVAAQKRIADEARDLALAEAARRTAAEAATAELSARSIQSEIERENLDDQIRELLLRRPAGACTVDGDLLRRLRAK